MNVRALPLAVLHLRFYCETPCQVLILFPIVQSAALLIFLIPWFVYAVYLASSGKVRPSVHHVQFFSLQAGRCMRDVVLDLWFDR